MTDRKSDIAAPDAVLNAGLTLLLLMQAAGAWLPAPWLWGLNHLRWFAPAWRIVVPLAGLALVWTPAGRRLGALIEQRLGPVVLGSRRVVYGAMPVLGGIAFWLLRDRANLLGDGQTLATLMAKDRLFHGFDFITYFAQAWIYQWTGAGGVEHALKILTLTSIVSGVAYLAAAAWSVRRLATGPGRAGVLYGLLILATPLQLFLGYAEVYAPLTVAMLVYLTYLLLHATGREPLWKPAVAWACALFLHLDALFLAPLLLAAAWRPGARDGRPLARLAALVLPPVAALALAAVLYKASGYTPARFRADFGHVESGGGILVPLHGRDGLLDWPHLKDVANLLLMLGGVPLVLLAAAAAGGRSGDGRGGRLLLAGAGIVVLLAAGLHMMLGMPRDWDLLAPHAAVLALAGWWLLAGAGRPAVAGPVVGTALLLALPWFLVNAERPRAQARIDAVMADAAPYPQGLLQEQLGHELLATGDQDGAIRHFRRAGEVCPGNPRFHSLLGTALFNRRDLPGAEAAYLRALDADSLDAYALKMGVLTAGLRGDHATALVLARRLVRLGRQDADSAEIHGLAASALGHPAEARAALDAALKLDPRRTRVWGYLGELDLAAGRNATAAEAYGKLLAAEPRSTVGQLGLARALWGGLSDPAAAPADSLRRILGLIDAAVADDSQHSVDPAAVAELRRQVAAALAARH